MICFKLYNTKFHVTSGQLDQKHHTPIGPLDQNFIKINFTEITFGPLDQKWSFSMLIFEVRASATILAAPPALAEAFQMK